MKKVFILMFLFVLQISIMPHSYAAKTDIKSEKIHVAKSQVLFKKIIVTDDAGKKYEYKIKGVCYAPDTEGALYYEDYKKDLPLKKAIGANSIRTYRPLGTFNDDGTINVEHTKMILDECLKEGLTVAVGFSYEDTFEGGILEQYLKEFGNHPAILMIALGNEYNYHYDEWFSKEEWLERLAYGVKISKTYAPNKIVATVHGEVPSKQQYREYVNAGVELIMLNIYRGATFGFVKDNWYELTDSMPWVVGEFGRSSKDGEGNDTSRLQASNLRSLIRGLESGYLFTLVDDPTKGDYQSNPNVGSEDSMGVFDKDRKPKRAVKIVKEEYDEIQGIVPYDR